MGFNTGVLLLNDAIGNIEKDPVDFQKNLFRAIFHDFRKNDTPVDFAIGNHVNGGTVFHMRHADSTGIYALGGNYVTLLGNHWSYSHHTPEAKLAILKELADQMGYTLHKKKAK